MTPAPLPPDEDVRAWIWAMLALYVAVLGILLGGCTVRHVHRVEGIRCECSRRLLSLECTCGPKEPPKCPRR